MKKKYLYFLLALAVAVSFGGCKKSGILETDALNEYLPMQPGKYIHYRLDSTRFVDFGQRDSVISYDARDMVDAAITDNLGRPSFRVIRSLRNLASTNEEDYVPMLTYMVTPTRENIEVSENNLRFLKLKLPVTEGFFWRGNSYLPGTPYYGAYQFSNDEDINLWDYTYEQVNQSAEINGNVYDSTVSILQVADSSNVPIEFPDGLAYKNYWFEQYAKNVGLVYKEVMMWEYQPPNSGNPGFTSGFGIRLSILDHN